MSYCVNCGVELAPGEKVCPLCKTPVINPNDKQTAKKDYQYPPETEYFVPYDIRKWVAPVALLMLIPVFATMLCDVIITGGITWSAYVAISIALIYVFVMAPLAMKKPNVFVCVAADCAATLLFLFLLEKLTGGQSWFKGFAMFLTLAGYAIVTVDAFLFTKLDLTKLLKTATLLFSVGLASVANELLISHYLIGHITFTWSLYALLISIILGAVCIIFDHNRKIKEKLKRKMFI